MAQKTITITLGKAEAASLQHVLTQAQAANIDKIGRTDATLSRVEKKIAEANAKASVAAAPSKGDEENQGDGAES